jgi:hypothetical protein
MVRTGRSNLWRVEPGHVEREFRRLAGDVWPMTFLHLGLLSLVGLAAIPPLLHLLTLHRLKTVELSTFRFLFDSTVQQRRKVKFLEAILAILRALFVLFMVLVASRPVLSRWSALFGGGTRSDVIMLVDGSASMNARATGSSAMDRARSTAMAIAERLPRDGRLTLVRATTHAEVIFSRLTHDAEDIRPKIESLTASPSRANLFAAFSEIFSSEDYRRQGQSVYLFTDCQASGWREVEELGLAQVLPRDTKIVVVNVGSAEPLSNRAVVGEMPQDTTVVVGLPIVLHPKVTNHSKTEPAQVVVGVTVGDRTVGQVTLDLKPGETDTGELVYVPREPGVHRGQFEIAPDAFPDDDSYLFTVQAVPPVKVVVVNGLPAPDPLESEALFVRTALQARSDRPEGPASGAVRTALPELAPSRDFAQSLDVQEIPEGALNPSILDGASVVVLANAGGLNPQHFSWLRDFVAGGGGLLVFPGDRVNHDVYSKQLFAAPVAQSGANPPSKPGSVAQRNAAVASPSDPLIDATLAAPVGDVQRLDSIDRLANISFAHSVFSAFDDPKAHYLATAQFFRRFKIAITEGSSTTWPLAYFRGGDPAFVESRLGLGVVILAAFPVNSKWSNLPLKPEFVPLMLRLVSYTMRPAEVRSPSVVPAGTPAEITVSQRWAPASGKVTDPLGHLARLQFDRSEGQLAAAVLNTADKGYYSVSVSGGASEQSRTAAVAFAVNLAPEESDFAMISSENLRQWFGNANVTMVDASGDTMQSAAQIGSDREIWRPVLAVMFGIITLEFMLSTLGGVTQREVPTVAKRLRDLNPGRWIGRMTGAEQHTES